MAKIELEVTLADGKTVRVTPTLEDTLAFETTLRKNRNWGELKDSALKLQPFRAWNALRRKGETDLTWEQFTTGDTAVLDVHIVDDEEEGDDELEVDGLGKGGPTGRSTTSRSASPSVPASASESGEASN